MKRLNLTILWICVSLCLYAQGKQDLNPVIENILLLQADDSLNEIQSELEKIKDSAPAAPQAKQQKSNANLSMPDSISTQSCGIDGSLRKLKRSNLKAYLSATKKYDEHLKQISKKAKQKSKDDQLCPNGITIIPIAYHIFHDGEEIGTANNYSLEDIRMATDQLNVDFSGTKVEKRNIAGDFHSFESGHTCIQFTIGKINRINRKKCKMWSVGALHNDLNTCLPGGSGVGSENDPNDYLNIYVTELSSGYLGVASSIPPFYGRVNGPEDGVTINSSIFVPGSKNRTFYNNGSVLSHEIGHWLGLPHVNGDINGAGCDADDGFGDTYLQSDQQFYHCGSELPMSCGTYDNVFNYMDYSVDCAKLMFTEEQALAMQHVMSNERKALSESFSRKNEDRQLYNNTCVIFDAKPYFEYEIVDCYAQVNLLEYQEQWYPSLYKKDGSLGGLTLFSWSVELRGQKTNNEQAIPDNELFNNLSSHSSDRHTDVVLYKLYIQCWDPYKKAYSEKQSAGRVMIVIKKCPAPENDELAKAKVLNYGDFCMEDEHILKNANPSEIVLTNCEATEDHADVWFKMEVPQDASFEVSIKSLSPTRHDMKMDIYERTDSAAFTCIATHSTAAPLSDLDIDTIWIRAYEETDQQDAIFAICTKSIMLSNNHCATATPVDIGSVCTDKIYHNNGATASGQPSNRTICGSSSTVKDVWYTAQAPANGILAIETKEVAGGITGSIIEVYRGDCETLIPIACSASKSYQPTLDLHGSVELSGLEANEDIWIRVISHGSIDEGQYILCVTDQAMDRSCAISYIEELAQTHCDDGSNTFDLTLRVHYKVAEDVNTMYINNKAYQITESPQEVTLSGLPADGKNIDIKANLGNGLQLECWGQSNYRAFDLTTAPDPCSSAMADNDECINAIKVPVNSTCEVQRYSNVGASWSEDHSEYFSCGASGHRPEDVWFVAQVPASGQMTISAPLLYNENNMILEAYSGSCSSLTLLDCDQFGLSSGSQIVLTDMEAGTTIYIRVADQGSNTQGEFALCVYDHSKAAMLKANF